MIAWFVASHLFSTFAGGGLLKLFLGNLMGDLKAVLAFLKAHSIWLTVSIVLASCWGVDHVISHRHSAKVEKQLTAANNALDTTKANLLAAADRARREDAANAERVKAEQSAINERSAHDFETRIAVARAAAERLRRASAANPGNGGGPPVSGVSASSGGAADGPGQNQLSSTDALTATEQAIQLDELISWIRRQHQVDPNKAPPHG